MERLTARSAGIPILAPECKVRFTHDELIDRLIGRLAAYEDTGLTPEKIAGIACELQVYRNAGKDGRLPLLLCKVDDTVYVVLVGRVFPFEVISVMLHGDTPTFKAQHGMHLCWVFGNDDIGKTVFLNREEAEAALRGGGNHA